MFPPTALRIRVEKPSPAKLQSLGVKSWPIWEKEVSSFPYHYDVTETCYLMEGKVRVKTDAESAPGHRSLKLARDGGSGSPPSAGPEPSVEFGAGELVTFPAGLPCTWEIIQPVRKHYKFG